MKVSITPALPALLWLAGGILGGIGIAMNFGVGWALIFLAADCMVTAVVVARGMTAHG